MTTLLAFVSLLFSGVLSPPPRLPASNASLLCKETPVENLLPSVVGPMAGARPAWFVDGGDYLFWKHAEHPVKILQVGGDEVRLVHEIKPAR